MSVAGWLIAFGGVTGSKFHLNQTNMNEHKVSILCNGIASIADALDLPFDAVLDDLVSIGLLDEDQESYVWAHMESL